MTIKWRIEGPFDSSYSLALLNREIALALDKLGVKVALHSSEGDGDFDPSVAFLEDNLDLKQLHERSFYMSQEVANITSRNMFPPRVDDLTCETKMMHLYAWEETAFPRKWAENFNKNLNGIVGVSTHVRRVLIDNGINVPIVVSGNGVDHWDRITPSNPNPFQGITKKSFVFLHVSSFFPRKGPDALLEAYGKRFSSEDDVCLIVKTFPNPHNEIQRKVENVQKKYPNYPEIIVMDRDISNSDLKALYLISDVLVAPSCAEGFGLPLAEAMLTGMPVITTNWSGQLDFCDEKNSWLVDYKFEQADTHFKLYASAWAAPDVDSLANAMKLARDSEESTRKLMAKRGREVLLKNFTWEKVADRMLRFIHKLGEISSDQDVRVGWISTWNVRCGVATYSEHLISGMENKPFILGPHDSDVLTADIPNSKRCWTVSDTDDLTELKETIIKKQFDMVVVQFNFGFFGHDHFINFMKSMHKLKVSVVIEMHATNDPPQTPDKKLVNYLPALELADRLIVHSIEDMNVLKKNGITHNLTLLPHGVIEAGPSKLQQNSRPTIATYGFCFPHKGLEEIIEAVSILKRQGTIIYLNMINSEYPGDFSKDLISSLKRKIQDLGLSEQILFETRFLSDEDSLHLLQQADLLLFTYHPTSESASGAVRYGLASGKSTLVTDLPIFSEFGDAVWRVEDNEPQRLAAKIKECLSHIRSESDDFVKKQELANQWIEQHLYSKLANRFEGMLEGLCMARRMDKINQE